MSQDPDYVKVVLVCKKETEGSHEQAIHTDASVQRGRFPISFAEAAKGHRAQDFPAKYSEPEEYSGAPSLFLKFLTPFNGSR